MPSLVQYIIKELRPFYEGSEAQSIAWWVAEEITGQTQTELILHGDCKITEKNPHLQEILARLRKKEPIQYIFGETQWRGLSLKVTRDTLIPRPETAELVDLIIAENHEPASIIDIGTGTGCIAIALKKERPCWSITAIDKSEGALQVAGQNAERHHVNILFQSCDILQNIPSNTGYLYDIVVSNPPYVRPSDETDTSAGTWEPKEAIFVPESDPLLFYRRIAELKIGRVLYFEINEKLSLPTADVLNQLGYQDIRLKSDSYGKERFITCRLVK